MGRQIEEKGHACEQIAVDVEPVVGLGEGKPVEQVMDTDGREPVVHIEGSAGAHIQPAVEIEVETPEVDQQHAARLEDAYGMEEGSLDVIDDRRGELVDK